MDWILLATSCHISVLVLWFSYPFATTTVEFVRLTSDTLESRAGALLLALGAAILGQQESVKYLLHEPCWCKFSPRGKGKSAKGDK